MAQYDVYAASGAAPFLLDLQTDLVEIPGTRLVAPLLPEARVPAPVLHLHPVFEVNGARLVMATHLLSAVPASLLKAPVANLSERADEITRALDFAFHGF